MEVLMVLVVVVFWLVKYVAKHPAREAKEYAAEQQAAASPLTPKGASRAARAQAARRTPPAASQRKRESLQRVEQWREAKRQQDDAGQLHSIHMDTCESKLDSLRVLYEAGILDREEYAERVARTRAKHFQKEA